MYTYGPVYTSSPITTEWCATMWLPRPITHRSPSFRTGSAPRSWPGIMPALNDTWAPTSVPVPISIHASPNSDPGRGQTALERGNVGRARRGPPRARGGVQRDQVHVRQPPGQQPAQRLGPPGLVVDVPDQRVLDGYPPPGGGRVVPGRVEYFGD